MSDVSQNKLMLMTLRFQLLNLEEKELIALYETPEKFKMFLDNTLKQMQNSEGFFFLKEEEISRKIQELNNELRFRFPDPENRALGNEVLMRLIQMERLDQNEKNRLLTSYAKSHLILRNYVTTEKNSFYVEELEHLLSFDTVAYDCLKNRSYQELLQQRVFLSSTNCFLNTFPEIYRKHPSFLIVTKEIIFSSLHSSTKQEDQKQYKKMARWTLNNIRQFERS